MSRLDLLTVFIVAVCLAALGFLVYKTIQLMNPPEMERSSLESSYDLPEDTTAWLTDDTLSYLDGNDNVASYDEDKDDEQVGKTLAEEEEAGVKAPTAQPKTSAPATSSKSSGAGTTTTKPAPSSSTSGAAAGTTRSSAPASAAPKASASTGSGTTTKAAPSTTSSTTTRGASTTTSTGKYSVVAGSFSKRANADSHAGSLRKLGYTRTEVVSAGAYASVVVNRFNSLKDAENLVLELRGKGVEAFVKTRQ